MPFEEWLASDIQIGARHVGANMCHNLYAQVRFSDRIKLNSIAHVLSRELSFNSITNICWPIMAAQAISHNVPISDFSGPDSEVIIHDKNCAHKLIFTYSDHAPLMTRERRTYSPAETQHLRFQADEREQLLTQ